MARRRKNRNSLNDWLVYALYRLLGLGLHLFPVPLTFLFGEILGFCGYLLLGHYRRLAKRNLRIAFPEWSDQEVRRCARRHFRHVTANLLCAFILTHKRWEQIEHRIDRTIYEHRGQEIEEMSSVVGALNHIGNWELFVFIPKWLPRSGYGAIFQRLRNRLVDEHIRRSRTRSGVELLDRSEGFNRGLTILRNGGALGVLVDQHAGDKGVWTPFFGRLASTTPLAAILAKKTDATIVRAALYTAGVARWRLEGEKYQPGSSVEETTFRVNLDLEEQVRRQPSDWFWVHDRWKTPNPRFLLSGYKRGVYVPDGFNLKPFEILIRSSNWLGDAVMSVEAVRRIKRGRPDARVTILVKKSLADFWESVPEVDAVIVFEPGESVFSVSRKLRNRFDVAILFPNSPRSGLEVWLAGIPRRVGYSRAWRDWFLNQFIPDPPKTPEIEHQSRHYLRIAERIGADMEEALPSVSPRNAERNLLGLCPGAEYGPAKRWPDFARAAKILADRHSLHWLIFGTAKEQELGSAVAAELGPSATDLTGKTSLAELMQQLRRCQLLLTNDTGTMHLASHLGVPVVAIFGSTDPVATGPKGDQHTVLRHPVECSPCFRRVCPIDFRCMTRITVDQVVGAVEATLSRPSSVVGVRKLGIS